MQTDVRRGNGSVAFDPNVWTRRALQEKTVRLEYTVLHQCIRPRIGADAPDHHGIRARPISLAAMPRRAIWVISSRMRWKDHFSISCFSLADLGGQRIVWRLHRVSPYRERFVLTHAAWGAGFIGLTSKLRPPWRTPQAMRAILLASAIASLNRLSRRAAASIQDLRPCFSQLCGRSRTARAAWTKSIRK